MPSWSQVLKEEEGQERAGCSCCSAPGSFKHSPKGSWAEAAAAHLAGSAPSSGSTSAYSMICTWTE